MMETLTPEQLQLSAERKRNLYTSEWTADNLTAILMDTTHGGIGLPEAAARTKAEHIMSWLRTITVVEVPEKRHGCSLDTNNEACTCLRP